MTQRRRYRGRRVPIAKMGLSVDKAAMWHIMSSRLYGSNVDRLALAVREALQNSRDAIKDAHKKGIRSKSDGKFEVSWGEEWVESRKNYEWWVTLSDNGIGMTPNVFENAFLQLGGTTKGADDEGGFGIAKAAILSLSKSFRWVLHSGNYLFVADGDIEYIEQRHADTFHQGVKLTIYDAPAGAFGGMYRGGLGYAQPEERIKFVLGANNLAPRSGYPGMRVYSQGKEVRSLFAGQRAKVLLQRAETDEATTIDIRAYRRSDGKTGRKYVRLAGLYQFDEALGGDTPVDMVVDVYTKLSARDDAYPLTASRNELSGQTYRLVSRVVREVMTNQVSSLSDDEEAEMHFTDAGELAEVERVYRLASQRMARMLKDPGMLTRMKMVTGGGALLRQMEQRHVQMQNKWRAAQRAREKAEEDAAARRADSEESWHRSSTGQESQAPAETDTGISVALLRQLQAKPKKERKARKRLSNPFAGFAAIRVNRKHFNSSRLRPYYANPDKWLNLALAWRFACQMVLNELGKDGHFEVGFILDDDTRALYLRKEERQVLMINPDWFSRSILKAYKGRPLNIAAVLHAKAAHEVTHLLGYGDHDTRFMVRREQVADETVGLLYPIAALVEAMLGVKAAPTAEARELAKLRKKLGNRNPTRASLRRHLLRGVRL
ncbi:MAG TPA: ATP-binding protein, partial [Planctomycetes bacterium]|nr:ATP-binding protein [Planctomycetota bacterium]